MIIHTTWIKETNKQAS